MNRYGVYALWGIGILIPFFTHAAGPIIRTGEEITVDASQVLEGDFYAAASTISISGEGKEDVYAVGGDVTINAPVAKDLTIIGGTAQVHGEVSDDVRALGGEVILAQPIKGDVVVIGGKLTVLSTAHIEGNVIFLGGSLVILGDVDGSIHANAGSIRLDSKVLGDVSVSTQSAFSLGNNARVGGDIHYKSYEDIVRAPNAEVTGEIQRTHIEVEPDFMRFYLIELSILVFGALAFFFILKRNIVNSISKTSHSLGTLGLIGLGVFLVIPFVGGVLMVSIIGLLFGIALFLAYALVLLGAFLGSGILLGYLVQYYFMRKTELTPLTILLGTLLFSFLGFIPYIGIFSMFAVTMVSLGCIAEYIYSKIRPQ